MFFFLCVIYAKIYYFHCNASGLPEELTDQAGQVVWRARYSTWGKLVFENISHFAPKGFSQNLRMQGQYADKETGLYYNTFRYYDPEIGRFTTEDPIGLLGGVNLYQYAPNPPMWIDPWGWSNSGQFKKIPGSTSRVRIDQPHVDNTNTQQHAHVETKDRGTIVVNQDGTPSHKTDPSKLTKKEKNYLRKKGFNC